MTRLKSNDKLFTTNKKDILKGRVISPLAFKESWHFGESQQVRTNEDGLGMMTSSDI